MAFDPSIFYQVNKDVSGGALSRGFGQGMDLYNSYTQNRDAQKKLALYEETLKRQLKEEEDNRRMDTALKTYEVMSKVDPENAYKLFFKTIAPDTGGKNLAEIYNIGGDVEDFNKKMGALVKIFSNAKAKGMQNDPETKQTMAIGLQSLVRKYPKKTQEIYKGLEDVTKAQSLLSLDTNRKGLALAEVMRSPESERPESIARAYEAGASPTEINTMFPKTEADTQLKREKFDWEKKKFAAQQKIDTKKMEIELEKLKRSATLSKDKTTRAFTNNVLNVLKVRQNLLDSNVEEEKADEITANMMNALSGVEGVNLEAIKGAFKKEEEKSWWDKIWGNKETQVKEQPQAEGPSEADIEYTAKKYNMTKEEVRKRLKLNAP